MTDIEQEACALRAAICGCGNGEDSHPEGRNPADDEMVARIMKAGFRRPASPATRGTVTADDLDALVLRADGYWPRLRDRLLTEFTITGKGDE